MATYNLGRILPRFRGQWDPTINYDKLDVVYFEGSSYMALSDNINKRPDENESDWILSAAKGEPGEPGKDGPTYKAGKGISITNNVISATGGGAGGETYFAGFGIEIDENTNNINAEVKADNDVPNKWENITFTGLPESIIDDWDETDIFYFKGGVYYSAGVNKHYKLNGTVWESTFWTGLNDFHGKDIYVDSKNNMIYLNGVMQVRYDNEAEMFLTMPTINITNPLGRFIFQGTNGYSYYSENNNKVYKIKDGVVSSTWTKIDTGSASFPGNRIWYDETNTYFSDGNRYAYFDYEREIWRSMSWQGVSSFSGFNIWHQGKHIFYSNGVNNYIKNGSKWEFIASFGANIFGSNVIYDGDKIYHYVDGHAKELVIPEPFYITHHGDKLATEEFVIKNGVVQNDAGYVIYRFVELEDNGLPSNFNGSVFYYNNDIYATFNGSVYKYNKETKKFTVINNSATIDTVEWTGSDWDGNVITSPYMGTSIKDAYMFNGSGWVKLDYRISPYAVYGKYGIAFRLEDMEWQYRFIVKGTTTDIMYGNVNVHADYPWVDYDGEIWIGEYKLSSTGTKDIDYPRPDLKLIEDQGLYVWTDIDGNIRLDTSDLHKILIGSGDDMQWVDYNYSGTIIPSNRCSFVVYNVGNRVFISYLDRYKTNRNDYLATEEYVRAQIGNIEHILETI